MRLSLRHSRYASYGFTLLEVLVALTILAAALTAGVRAAGMATRSAGELRTRSLADFVAQNQLAERRMRGDFPEPGSYSGSAEQGGMTFNFTEEVLATPNPRFRRIEIRVFSEDNSEHALGSLSGFLLKSLR